MDAKSPAVGEVLTHKFRKRKGEAYAEVTAVDEAAGKISVRVDGVEYASLSAAAKAVSGGSHNGWIYWGLKKEVPYRRRE